MLRIKTIVLSLHHVWSGQIYVIYVYAYNSNCYSS
ncbi:hypothetical protein Leryth_012380 [Lithospermum erythrorhizon]|nr:hypothetical protein Leryth_012380 [Lithospermum erythrorhizon]